MFPSWPALGVAFGITAKAVKYCVGMKRRCPELTFDWFNTSLNCSQLYFNQQIHLGQKRTPPKKPYETWIPSLTQHFSTQSPPHQISFSGSSSRSMLNTQSLLPLHYWCQMVYASQLCLLYPCAADVCERKMNRVLLMSNKCLAPSRDLFLLFQGTGKEEHNLFLLSRPHWLFSSHRNVSHHKHKALFFWVRKPTESMQLSCIKKEQVCPLFCLWGSKPGTTETV